MRPVTSTISMSILNGIRIFLNLRKPRKKKKEKNKSCYKTSGCTSNNYSRAAISTSILCLLPLGEREVEGKGEGEGVLQDPREGEGNTSANNYSRATISTSILCLLPLGEGKRKGKGKGKGCCRIQGKGKETPLPTTILGLPFPCPF